MRRNLMGKEVSTEALSTPSTYAPLVRRSLRRATVVSVAIVAVIFTVAFGPLAFRNPEAFAAAMTRPGALHAPDLGLIAEAPLAIQLHLLTLAAAIGVTGVLLFGVKGERLHRTLGWTWIAAMMTTAVAALFIKAAPFGPHIGPFGVLHIFSAMTLVGAPQAVLAARRHDVARHARLLSGLVVGGLGLAGLAAFLPGRLMWAVFFG